MNCNSMILLCLVGIFGFSVNTVDGFGLIQNVAEGTCLANANGGVADMERITLVPCDISATNQLWNVLGMVDHAILPNTIIGRNGKCLDGSSGTPASYTYMYSCTPSAKNHQWQIVNGDYSSTFALQCLVANKCLTNGGAGVGVVANTDCVAGASNQAWRVIPSSSNLLSTCSKVLNPLPILG